MQAKKKILVMYEVLSNDAKHLDHHWMQGKDDWRDEYEVVKHLKSLGHQVELFGILDDVRSLMNKVQAFQPDLVFNMAEAFANDRKKEAHLMALLELLSVKYTGVQYRELDLCKDKALSKVALAQAGVNVPNFAVSRYQQRLRKIPTDFIGPYIVKPLGFEGSEAIHQCSIVDSPTAALKRVEFLHDKYQTDVIVESFVLGHDVYVGVIGRHRLKVLPAVQLRFADHTNPYNIASYKAKWSQAYQRRKGIKRVFLKDELLVRRLALVAKKAYRTLGLNSYARIDFRVTPENKIYFLEANPNPAINSRDEFAIAAKKAGLKQKDLVELIVKLGLAA